MHACALALTDKQHLQIYAEHGALELAQQLRDLQNTNARLRSKIDWCLKLMQQNANLIELMYVLRH